MNRGRSQSERESTVLSNLGPVPSKISNAVYMPINESQSWWPQNSTRQNGKNYRRWLQTFENGRCWKREKLGRKREIEWKTGGRWRQ